MKLEKSVVQPDTIRSRDANLLGAPCPPPKSSHLVQIQGAISPLLLPHAP